MIGINRIHNIVTNKKEKLSYTVKIDLTTIKESKCIKYLGVLLSDSLSKKPQIEWVSFKLAGRCEGKILFASSTHISSPKIITGTLLWCKVME